jgi:hypothetical protein
MRSEAGRELSLSVGALAAILVLTALVAINLLQRMTPALAEVLEENVNSMDAVGGMLASLATVPLSEAEAAAAARKRFSVALGDAANNRSEPEEAALIAELQEIETAALRGEPLAVLRAQRALEALGQVNRAAMQQASVEAQRLGIAGAWAVALLGMFGFGASLVVTRRLVRRIVAPLQEVERVLLAVERGDRLQRCATRGFRAHPHQLLCSLNRLLDASSQRSGDGGSTEGSMQLVPWLLDAWGGPIALIDGEGRIFSASREALELLASEQGPALREVMSDIARGGPDAGLSIIQRSEAWALVSLASRARESDFKPSGVDG